MTLSEILSALYDETGNSTTPAPVVTTRLTRFVNEGIRTILSEPGLARLRDSDTPYTFATVANLARYVVPEAVAKIVYITERTNDRKLDVLDLASYRTICPDPTASSGSPDYYVPIGRVAVATQPSDASAVFVKSTSASDTTQTAYVEGITTGGYQRTASVTLTGTTAVAVGSITDFIEITDVYVSAACVGTVTLLEDSGAGTELARISIAHTRPRYYGFYLFPTPSAVITLYVDYRRELVDLVNAASEPPLPSNWHPMLVAYGLMREYERLNDLTRMKSAAERYTLAVQRLKATINLPDEVLIPGRGGVGRSDLGGAYPAGTIWD